MRDARASGYSWLFSLREKTGSTYTAFLKSDIGGAGLFASQKEPVTSWFKNQAVASKFLLKQKLAWVSGVLDNPEKH